ncbi:MAG: 2Fe-2S iron-sulfur cluster binding domain-containing protein [Acidimicrobiia bacterium]|nr:2Fe-2S iron-sulfur cluster binding domain-containing protein [Acidimicrobiia bacterium]
MIQFEVDGRQVEVPDDGASLLEVLRDRLGIHSPKDGCSPQGQCGCCTVLVDGQPRVACVTPARRVRDRTITTLDGFDPDRRARWADAFCATGASQCGFCTPGIIVRLDGLYDKKPGASDAEVERALQAHLCRCTGWRTILDAWHVVAVGTPVAHAGDRDLAAAARRAEIEGGVAQEVGPQVALGAGHFAADEAPADSLVAVPDLDGGWAVADTLAAARAQAGKVQGRRTTVSASPPLDLPAGEWAVTLRTSWVEPAYLETDASWCVPGGEPYTPLANGGAFGAKLDSVAPAAARRLADEHGVPVRVLLSREDSVRLGAKRPPIAAGLRADGSGMVRVVRTPGIAERIRSVLPDVTVEEVDVAGPPTSSDIRGAGWAEAWVLRAALADAPVRVDGIAGGWAEARIDDGVARVTVAAGDALDEVVLRSYCVGAAHMALGWVASEGLAVDDDGVVHDLTIRSFGVLRAIDTPAIEVEIDRTPGPSVNGSDAVFAAVAGAAWLAGGRVPDWPTGHTVRTTTNAANAGSDT